jgi:hypothetical protein
MRPSRVLLAAGAGLAAIGFSGAFGCGGSGSIIRDCQKHPEECPDSGMDLPVPLDLGTDLAQPKDSSLADSGADGGD